MKYRLIILIFFVSTVLLAQQKPSQQWLDQKFSMFIHFGLYSVYGGVYDGEPVRRGYSEQIQSFAGIFSDWYADTAGSFNPVKWNPDSIVALAKAAGMKSIVFTSKHHDGFCMYHSQYTDFNIVDATPYGRDLMKELADACARGGIGFSVYYSLIDWHFPQAYPISSHNADPLTMEHLTYNYNQVEEIMKNYGPISEIWFDMGSLEPKQSKMLYDLVNRLQPNCMISGRLGNDYVDFAVMGDNEYPDYKLDIPWQTAASMFNETWGYRSWQERGEIRPKVDEKINSLIKVISRGGNYLLNIGPRGDGSVVEFEHDVLTGIGKWVKNNSEAIYGTRANPFDHTFEWGDVTVKGNQLFAFVEKMPASGKIDLSGFTGKVKDIRVLSSGETCRFSQKENLLEIYLPQHTSDKLMPVLKIDFQDGFEVVPANPVTGNELTPQNATPVFGHSSLNYYGSYKSLIGYDWNLRRHNNQVTPELLYTDNERGRVIEVDIDGKKQEVTLRSDHPKTVRLPKNSVKWGNLYRKPGSMVFGNVGSLEGAFPVSVDENWQKVNDLPYRKTITEKISPKTSVVFLQEIESEKERPIAVKITSGNAVYVLLNGRYITAHFSPDRVHSDNELVLLPLKKGNNQLVVAYYNGFANEFSYEITPLQEWTVYSQKLAPTKPGTSFSIRAADAVSKVAPLRLNNITVYF